MMQPNNASVPPPANASEAPSSGAAPSVKICGYCRERVAAAAALKVQFGLQGNRTQVILWFCGGHCCFWAGSHHSRSGAATTVKGLRERFGAGLEVVKK